MTRLLRVVVALVALVVAPSLFAQQTIASFIPYDYQSYPGNGAGGTYALNALNESGQVIGRLYLAAGSGTKTLSAGGGGSILTWIGGSTFATASSELRMGLEDLTSGGVGDGTQDVYGTKIAGTDTITASAINRWTMTSGTKTVTHGDNLAITVRMPVRAGADGVNFQTYTLSTTFAGSTGLPYGAANGAKAAEFLYAVIQFDDGTYGWIAGANLLVSGLVSASINLNSTPDEYIATFTIPAPIQLSRIGWPIDDTAAADDYEINLYSDPYGANPVLVRSAFIDSSAITNESSTTVFIWADITPTTMQAGPTYGVSVRPTTANSITVYYGNLGSGFQGLKTTSFGILSDVKVAARTNNAGPFTETQVYHAPYFGMTISGFVVSVPSGSVH